MKHAVKLAGLLALLATFGLTGCATTQDIEALRVQVDRANANADAALKAANEAKAIAQDAKVTAETAKMKAETTETKIDRMFKKAMYK